MNNRKLILIIIVGVIAFNVASATAYFLLLSQYKEYSDEYIQVKIPMKVNFSI